MTIGYQGTNPLNGGHFFSVIETGFNTVPNSIERGLTPARLGTIFFALVGGLEHFAAMHTKGISFYARVYLLKF